MPGALLDLTVPESVSEEKVTVAGLSVRLLRKGEGPPLVVVHDSLGNLGWVPFYEQLSSSFTVVVPDMPGYGRSDRPEWARSHRDEAILLHLLLDELGLDRVVLVGFGFGGYVAAEMATMNQRRLSHLVLVGAAGIKPTEGEIADQMFTGFAEYGMRGFRDLDSFRRLVTGDEDNLPQEVYDLWDLSTEMTARICWKPLMHSPHLPPLLTAVRTPTLVVWGGHDALVPIDVGRQYERVLPNARLEIVPDAGHVVELEEPDALARLVRDHFAAHNGGQA